ncbi:hypothetical protein [Parasitella parasitica]|uniref:DDE-1 domain-containing protein n=1 Tax=Parasitella parasitica TaxID=35722 RepID=A0A0B7MT41_9FUNG|nr:hypothetical protein [Parasitella parasitica]
MKWFNNSQMIREGRNVLLLLDNAPVHDSSFILSNVKLLFLPPNTTSHTQPLDAGIIANFKNHYRNLQYENVSIKYSTLKDGIESNDQGPSTSTTLSDKVKPFYWISQLQAMKWIKMSSNRAESNTISNCWKQTMLVSNDEEEVDNLDLGSQIEIEDMEFNDEEIHGDIIDEDPTMLDENDDQVVGNENGKGGYDSE